MYTLYQIYLEKAHMEVGIFALDVVDMKQICLILYKQYLCI